MGNEEKSFAFLPVDTDWHTHPFQGERNYDGMRRYAESALAKGLKRVIFTEHAPVDPRFGFLTFHGAKIHKVVKSCNFFDAISLIL